MSKVIEGVAYSLGVQAFKNGNKCIPALDKLFLDSCLKDTKVGEGIPYIKSWIRGWTDANLGVHDENLDPAKIRSLSILLNEREREEYNEQQKRYEN